MQIIGGLALISFGIYSMYDSFNSQPQSAGGKMWQVKGFGAGALSLGFGILLLVENFI